jgi:hypothetical protein
MILSYNRAVYNFIFLVDAPSVKDQRHPLSNKDIFGVWNSLTRVSDMEYEKKKKKRVQNLMAAVRGGNV